MTIKAENKRFVVIIDKEIYEKFKDIASKENRSASNLAVKLIKDYVSKNSPNS